MYWRSGGVRNAVGRVRTKRRDSAAGASGYGLAPGDAEDDALAGEGRGGRKIYGPGVLDMKAGVAMALMAMRVLGDWAKSGVSRPVTLLLNSARKRWAVR